LVLADFKGEGGGLSLYSGGLISRVEGLIIGIWCINTVYFLMVYVIDKRRADGFVTYTFKDV